MSALLPTGAFPIGGKVAGAGVFVVAVLVGLMMYTQAKSKKQNAPSY